MDVEAVGEFDCTPPALSTYIREPNIMRKVWGIKNEFPGAPSKLVSDISTQEIPADAAKHEKEFDLRFYTSDKPRAELYVHNHMKPHMLRTEVLSCVYRTFAYSSTLSFRFHFLTRKW